MIDQEKVMKGLECCGDMTGNKCGECPYKKECEEGIPGAVFAGAAHLAADALFLVKDQQARIAELEAGQTPRVMTLEEVKGVKRLTICAVEQRSKVIKNTFNAEYGGIVTLGNENFLDFGLYGDTNRYRRTEAGYGKTWRCWTSRPTDEQREAVKWE